MPRAFQSKGFFSTANDRVVKDGDTAILKGVTILEVGKMAVFQSKQPDGTVKVRKVMIDPEHVSAILSHAAPVTPSHWTHDYHGKDDPLSAQIGGISNVRREDNKVVGDLMLAPTRYKDQALWNAEKMPEHMMLSPVFDFNPNDPKCIPTSFDAADLVESGAGVTALWTALLAEADSTENNSSTMTPEELCPLLDDPKIKAMIQGMITGHTKAEGEMEDAAADGAEKAGGVNDDDKKDEEKQAPALMAAVTAKVPGARLALATFRLAKTSARLAKAAPSIESIKVLIKASETAGIGQTKALLATVPGFVSDASPATAFMGKIKTELAKPGMTQGTAIARARKDAISAKQGNQIEEWEKAGRPMPE